jgi:hypothetical protein
MSDKFKHGIEGLKNRKLTLSRVSCEGVIAHKQAGMITVRTARLEDCERIASLAQAHISTWQHWDTQGRVEDVSYSGLTIYERWLHGGAWMSFETSAIHLGRLLLGAGIALVAEASSGLVGYVEAYVGQEPEPFGAHLHIGQLLSAAPTGTDEALLDALAGQLTALKLRRIMATTTGGEKLLRAFEAVGAKPVTQLRRFSMSARTGQGLYKAVPDATIDPRQIAGWAMPIGRATSARQEWETRWLNVWDALPELKARTRRLHMAAGGQEAFVVVQRGVYDERSAEIACWTPRILSGVLLTSLRDWAHREGYRSLSLLVTDETIKTLGAEAEDEGYVQAVWAIGV